MLSLLCWVIFDGVVRPATLVAFCIFVNLVLLSTFPGCCVVVLLAQGCLE